MLLADDDQGTRPPQKLCLRTSWFIPLCKNNITITQRICIVATRYRSNHVVIILQFSHGVTRKPHRIIDECRKTPWNFQNRPVTPSYGRYGDQVEQVLLYARSYQIPHSYRQTTGPLCRTKSKRCRPEEDITGNRDTTTILLRNFHRTSEIRQRLRICRPNIRKQLKKSESKEFTFAEH